MEELVRTALGCQSVRATGRGGGGCISQGQVFIVDDKDQVFVKENEKAKVHFVESGFVGFVEQA
jgi:protein-ribulosamine 3-kinase